MSAWLYPDWIVFVPYIFLAFAMRGTARPALRGLVLALTVLYVGTEFWFSWDAAYIHPSTMNAIPGIVAIVAALFALVTDLLVRQIERRARRGAPSR